MQVLAIDCGGTFIKGALVSAQGEILRRQRIPTAPEQGQDAVRARLVAMAAELRAQAGAVAALGLAFAGPLDAQAGIVIHPPAFPDWHDVPLKQQLEDKLHLPVYLENDANLATLGEYWQGAGQQSQVLVGLTLGTGVGGGIIINGQLFTGASGIAGEIGHIPIAPEGPKCGCGSRGCLESMASANAVLRMAREKLAQRKTTRHDWGPAAELTAKKVYELAVNGDTMAQQVFEQMGKALGTGLAAVVNLLAPDRIVIGGGGAGAWEFFIDSVRQVLQERVFQRAWQHLEIVPARLGEQAGIWGAAYLALQHVGDPA